VEKNGPNSKNGWTNEWREMKGRVERRRRRIIGRWKEMPKTDVNGSTNQPPPSNERALLRPGMIGMFRLVVLVAEWRTKWRRPSARFSFRPTTTRQSATVRCFVVTWHLVYRKLPESKCYQFTGRCARLHKSIRKGGGMACQRQWRTLKGPGSRPPPETRDTNFFKKCFQNF